MKLILKFSFNILNINLFRYIKGDLIFSLAEKSLSFACPKNVKFVFCKNKKRIIFWTKVNYKKEFNNFVSNFQKNILFLFEKRPVILDFSKSRIKILKIEKNKLFFETKSKRKSVFYFSPKLYIKTNSNFTKLFIIGNNLQNIIFFCKMLQKIDFPCNYTGRGIIFEGEVWEKKIKQIEK